MIAIGIGANSRARRDDFIAVIASTVSEIDGCDVVATLEGTSFSSGLKDAASFHGLEFRPLAIAALRQRNGDCITRSDLTLDLLGIASVAEASALAAAGPGSQLLTPRHTIGHVTVATARSADAKEDAR